MSKKKVDEVKFLTSLALALPVNDVVKHVQITLVQVGKTDELRCYFDVVDPTKIKLAEDAELSEPGNT